MAWRSLQSEPLMLPEPKTIPMQDVSSLPQINIVKLDAPLIKQLPELYNGCEITSLAMLLQFHGIAKNKMELVGEMKKDPAPMKTDAQGNITYWGNPNLGFVGDITGKEKGYSIYHSALFDLLKNYIPTAVDLTNHSFDTLEQQLAQGVPVIAWTTTTYVELPKWVVWDSPTGPVRATFSVHSVLLVGYDQQYVYVNDPLSGVKGQQVDKQQFIRSWEALGKQALSYTPPNK
ncbi:C39 family peptidase [Paenibacillus sp. LC231]|uniref:C39 family peptidase n=1 Tax=Paenibacillus sp. LC231 TaxID=1120679 RepID=UPI001F2146FF|nr:C39 family peptidase [Paenibacillus sp. LC231]